MKKFKFLISFALIVFFFLFLAEPVLAAVVKTSGNLRLTLDNEPLFGSGLVWAPGNSHLANFIVRNLSGDGKEVQVEAFDTSQTGGLAEKMFIRFSQGGADVYGVGDSKTMKDFWDDGEVSLGSLTGGGEKTYTMIVTMNAVAGNAYQGQTAGFDMRIGFKGEEAVTVGVGGGAGGAGEPFVCTDTKPGLPTGFVASAGPGTGEVSLSWTPPVEPYTYFLIAYSDTADWPPKWGNPDIGKTNSFVVSGLASGTYWFWLRAGNGCMPGDFVGPISPGFVAGAAVGGPAVGFLPGVLGEKTPGQLGEGIATEAGEVAGVEAKPVCFWWWILALLEAALVWFYGQSVRRAKKRFSWSLPLTAAVLAFVGDYFVAHRFFTPSQFCRWMWLWVILAAAIPSGFCLWCKKR